MEIAGLSCLDGIQEFKGEELMILDAGGFAESIGRPILSGLPSPELLKLVTIEEAFDKWVIVIFAESSIPSAEFTVSIPIRSCREEESDGLL